MHVTVLSSILTTAMWNSISDSMFMTKMNIFARVIVLSRILALVQQCMVACVAYFARANSVVFGTMIA